MLKPKCSTCGVAGAYRLLSGGMVETVSEDEPYPRCPAITERLQSGVRENISVLSCTHYRKAYKLARSRYEIA
jgi:hypothetical protein